MPAKGPLGSSGRVSGGSSAGGRGSRGGGGSASVSKPSARSLMAVRRAKVSAMNKAAGVSSNTKRSTGFMSSANSAASKAKRRIGTIGKAAGSVSAKANKEIKAERKARGEYLYEKEYYGRPSVNQRKPAAKVKPSSGRMSSRPNPKPRKGNQR